MTIEQSSNVIDELIFFHTAHHVDEAKPCCETLGLPLSGKTKRTHE